MKHLRGLESSVTLIREDLEALATILDDFEDPQRKIEDGSPRTDEFCEFHAGRVIGGLLQKEANRIRNKKAVVEPKSERLEAPTERRPPPDREAEPAACVFVCMGRRSSRDFSGEMFEVSCITGRIDCALGAGVTGAVGEVLFLYHNSAERISALFRGGNLHSLGVGAPAKSVVGGHQAVVALNKENLGDFLRRNSSRQTWIFVADFRKDGNGNKEWFWSVAFPGEREAGAENKLVPLQSLLPESGLPSRSFASETVTVEAREKALIEQQAAMLLKQKEEHLKKAGFTPGSFSCAHECGSLLADLASGEAGCDGRIYRDMYRCDFFASVVASCCPRCGGVSRLEAFSHPVSRVVVSTHDLSAAELGLDYGRCSARWSVMYDE